jgi:hypothetical protein
MLNKAPRPEASDGDYYQHHQLFIYSVLSHANQLIEEYNVGSQVKRELSNVRSRLMSQTRSDGQRILYLYLKQHDSMFRGMLKLPVFHTYNNIVNEFVSMLSAVVGQE